MSVRVVRGDGFSLREKQTLFAVLKAQLVLWIREQGWAVAEGEGYVALTDGKDGDHDGPHKAGGAHYMKLGQDLDLFVGGTWTGDVYVGGDYVSTGGHPAWRAIGERWESMHPLCRWGGRFEDDNHISIAHAGRA